MSERQPDRTLSPEPVDLDREAQITEADRIIAPRFWQHYATPLFRRLLNAKAEK